ncbi:RHS repeat-associated core domain-containing protein [Pseudomonas sp. C32]|uniref:RHS repeat-associated core domain-containing protein n=1 Tax=Pseudomonas sp. C32 TaxID=1529208 RepID=UPI00262771A1|nr:RHS repeat-associated core domain-containing protein [Pseudomonas sp. C32]MDN4546485.1 RHS repeat-associated core domain-containing protein [Pseudomonas sp. C32]
MSSNRETLLCRYRYDPLDRLVVSTPSAQSDAQRFYVKDRLATEIQGALQCSIMQHDDQLLAQQQRQNGTAQARLLATDQQRSVLNVLDATHPHPLAYSPYGHRHPGNGLLSLLGFNGERPDPVTGWYLLGNGYRAFNPVLMRFNSPDSWSPFGEGGFNGYGYCAGEPVNRVDPSGHMFTRGPFLISAPTRASSLNINKLVKYPLQKGQYKSWHTLSPDIEAFVDTYKNQPRLNFVAHGAPTPRFKGTRIPNGDEALNAEGLHNLAKEKGIKIKDHANIRLVICHSANGGSSSIAAELSTLTGLPVKGYRGTVAADNNLKQSITLQASSANRTYSASKPALQIYTTNAVMKEHHYDAVKFIRGKPVRDV